MPRSPEIGAFSPPSQTRAATPPVVAGAANGAGPTQRGEVAVRYLGSTPVRVGGPVTRRAYLFSAAEPVQAVALQDAPALLGTPYFRRAG